MSRVQTWLAWAASRAGILVIIGYGHAQAHTLTDVRLYQRWYDQSLSHGIAPHDSQWNYPPGAAITLWLAGLLTPYFVGLLLVVLAADVAILRTIRQHATSSWGPAFWIVAPFLLGPVVLSRFDLVPTAFAVGGLVAGPLAAGALLGTGALVKAWPAVILGLRALGDRTGRTALLAGAAASGLVMLAVIAITDQWGSLTSWLGGNGARGLQIESVAGTPWVLARSIGFDIPAPFNHGSMQIGGPGTTPMATLCSIAGLVVIVWAIRARLRGAPLLELSAATVLWLTITAKVLSPQYLIWSMGLVALTRSRRAMALMGAAALMTQALFPTTYLAFVNGNPTAASILAIRNVLMVCVAIECTRAVNHARARTASGPATTTSTQSRPTHVRLLPVAPHAPGR